MTLPSFRTAAWLLLLAGSAAAAEPDLQPYQMVRSLQLLQDRIAAGDHAALPMQNKLLTLIDERLRQAGADEFADARNVRATLIYAMSGGNPDTVEGLFVRVPPPASEAALVAALLNYLKGARGKALAGLDGIDPLALPQEVGAFVALVKATVVSAQDRAVALDLFDQARLLGVGTLVEEAALRRSIDLSATTRDQVRFFRLSDQYARRFLDSPYAAQFAEAFIVGLLAFGNDVDTGAFERVTSEMQPERQRYIYLQVARRAAIEGYRTLSAFAADKTQGELARAPSDARSELYSSLAAVTSDNAAQLLERLKALDSSALSADDKRLLDAAVAVASEVVSAPTSAQAEAATPIQPTAASADRPGADTASADAYGSMPVVSDARQKLQAIDRMLEQAE